MAKQAYRNRKATTEQSAQKGETQASPGMIPVPVIEPKASGEPVTPALNAEPKPAEPAKAEPKKVELKAERLTLAKLHDQLKKLVGVVDEHDSELKRLGAVDADVFGMLNGHNEAIKRLEGAKADFLGMLQVVDQRLATLEERDELKELIDEGYIINEDVPEPEPAPELDPASEPVCKYALADGVYRFWVYKDPETGEWLGPVQYITAAKAGAGGSLLNVEAKYVVIKNGVLEQEATPAQIAALG